MSYRKVMWSGPAGKTAGLVFEDAKLSGLTLSDISRFWPYSETRKMSHMSLSPHFETWEAAFAYQFPEGGDK